MLFIPVSHGEVIDRITILLIKIQKAESSLTRFRALYELCVLIDYAKPAEWLDSDQEVVQLAFQELFATNSCLWDLVNKASDPQEASKDPHLAATIQLANKDRSESKQSINELFQDKLCELKEYDTDNKSK